MVRETEDRELEVVKAHMKDLSALDDMAMGHDRKRTCLRGGNVSVINIAVNSNIDDPSVLDFTTSYENSALHSLSPFVSNGPCDDTVRTFRVY